MTNLVMPVLTLTLVPVVPVGSPFGQDIDLGDIFNSVFGGFGGFGGGGRRANPNAPRRGTDVETSVYVSFEEAAKGAKKKIQYKVISTCPECNGTGAAKGTSPKTCTSCNGSGRVTINQRTPFGVVQTQKACGACHGQGKIVKNIVTIVTVRAEFVRLSQLMLQFLPVLQTVRFLTLVVMVMTVLTVVLQVIYMYL